MILFLRKRWPLFAILVVFVIFKIPHLFYPYYWDESWPYATAVTEMYHHGASLMPGSISGEVSRGHPLFFHAAGALWMDVFGASHFAMHSFALCIALFCLVAVYEAGLSVFNQRVAELAVILVATQALFFLQSSFLLLEILTALLGFVSLHFYVRDKFVLTAICLTALFYTKESGLIMGFVLGADALVSLFRATETLQVRLYRILSVVIPCLLIAAFFIIQKRVSGWYVLPLYTDTIEHSWRAFWYKFRMGGIRDTFHAEMRYWYFVIVLALSVLAAIKNKSVVYLVIFLPATVLYYYVDDMRAGRLLPSIPFFVVFILCICLYIYSLRKLNFFPDSWQNKFIVLTIVFTFLYLCFSAMNFYINRYMLSAIVPLLFFVAVVLDKLIQRTYHSLFYPVLTGILLIGFISLKADVTHGDTRRSLIGMKVQQDVVDFLELHNDYDSAISSGSFLECQHLKDPATGFLRSAKNFRSVRWEIDTYTRFIIFDNIEPDYRYNDFLKDPSFHRIHRFERDTTWNEIYERQ